MISPFTTLSLIPNLFSGEPFTGKTGTVQQMQIFGFEGSFFHSSMNAYNPDKVAFIRVLVLRLGIASAELDDHDIGRPVLIGSEQRIGPVSKFIAFQQRSAADAEAAYCAVTLAQQALQAAGIEAVPQAAAEA